MLAAGSQYVGHEKYDNICTALREKTKEVSIMGNVQAFQGTLQSHLHPQRHLVSWRAPQHRKHLLVFPEGHSRAACIDSAARCSGEHPRAPMSTALPGAPESTAELPMSTALPTAPEDTPPVSAVPPSASESALEQPMLTVSPGIPEDARNSSIALRGVWESALEPPPGFPTCSMADLPLFLRLSCLGPATRPHLTFDTGGCALRGEECGDEEMELP
ncbi:hypothetical protein MHYP_G00316930 [Metynnis hypsauchen]